jgi:hypothetical protein
LQDRGVGLSSPPNIASAGCALQDKKLQAFLHVSSNNSVDMLNTGAVNCSALVERKSFEAYVESINSSTFGNLSLASQCRSELCNALWGSGNPDISGIGVSGISSLSNVAIVFLIADL